MHLCYCAIFTIKTTLYFVKLVSTLLENNGRICKINEYLPNCWWGWSESHKVYRWQFNDISYMTITPPHQQIFCCSIFTDFFLSVNLAPNSYRFLKEPIYLCCYRVIFHPYWSFLVCWTPSSFCVLWCLMFSLLACCYISPRGLFSCFSCIIVVSSSQATMQYWELFWSSVARWPNLRPNNGK